MRSTRGHVLISGASIAGPALAYWLSRYGWEPVVIERAPALREAGQNIDLRGAGREVARLMGIENAIADATTGELGTRFVGRDGTTRAEFRAGTDDTAGATKLEILRGNLARLLVEHTRNSTEYRFDESITELHDHGDRVNVCFANRPDEDFDLVIAADGMRSTTRPLIVGNAATIVPKGVYTAYFTIPREGEDSDWWRWYSAPGGRTLNLRPGNTGTLCASLSFLSPPRGYENLDEGAQRALLAERFSDAGWLAPRVVEQLQQTPEFYFEHVGQVHSPIWSRGRAALLGDSAYCASPLSGMGTSLALTGAYVLAGELTAHVHHQDAFRAYERIMRPYVAEAQDLPLGTPRLAIPRTRAGIATLHSILRLAATAPARRLSRKLFEPPADQFELPDYTHLRM